MIGMVLVPSITSRICLMLHLCMMYLIVHNVEGIMLKKKIDDQHMEATHTSTHSGAAHEEEQQMAGTSCFIQTWHWADM